MEKYSLAGLSKHPILPKWLGMHFLIGDTTYSYDFFLSLGINGLIVVSCKLQTELDLHFEKGVV